MAYLPTFDPSDLATKADLHALGESLRGEFALLRAEFAEMRAETRSDLGRMNQRIDRLFITLVAGLFTIVAAMAGVMTATLL